MGLYPAATGNPLTVATYRWNEQAGRYADSRGRFISEIAVRRVVDDIADAASERMAAAAQSMLEGRISLGAFQVELQQAIKVSHVASGVIARGGAAQMSPADWLFSAREIKAQYAFARVFAEQVASGAQKLDGTVVSRARQYGAAVRGHFAREYGRGQQARGFASERNQIRSGESCSGCRAESARGIVPIGSLTPIGQRSPCRVQCKCRLVYSRVAEAVA